MGTQQDRGRVGYCRHHQLVISGALSWLIPTAARSRRPASSQSAAPRSWRSQICCSGWARGCESLPSISQGSSRVPSLTARMTMVASPFHRHPHAGSGIPTQEDREMNEAAHDGRVESWRPCGAASTDPQSLVKWYGTLATSTVLRRRSTSARIAPRWFCSSRCRHFRGSTSGIMTITSRSRISGEPR